MQTLLPILIASLFFAYLTEVTTYGKYGQARQFSVNKLFFCCLLLTLAFPVGLRTYYNDTWNYISGFQISPSLRALLASGELSLMQNPAFLVYRSLVRSFTDNYHIFLFIPALFVQYAYIVFIRRYSPSFTLGIAIYFLFGGFVFSLAAMKQTIAMAILLFSVPQLLEKKYVRFYLLVFISFLFHTYAIAFAIMPLFTVKPWSIPTFLLLAVTVFVMTSFESVITAFLDAANETGKTVAEYEVFDNNQINIIRVLVYAVVPLASLVLNSILFSGTYNKDYNLLIHMSIFAFAFMLLGTINGANMFGRMASYFDFGIICSLPWIIKKAFEPRSAKLVYISAIVCFFIYFFYANHINTHFDSQYQSITLIDFIVTLF